MAIRRIPLLTFAVLGAASAVFAQAPAPFTVQPPGPAPAPVVTSPSSAPAPVPAAPAPVPAVASCVGFCGGQSNAGCYCDSVCTSAGDCCADFDDVCDLASAPSPSTTATGVPPPGPAPSTSGPGSTTTFSTATPTGVPPPSTATGVPPPGPAPSTSGPGSTTTFSTSTATGVPPPSTSVPIAPAPVPGTSFTSGSPTTVVFPPSTSVPAPSPSVPIVPRPASCGDQFVSSIVGAPNRTIGSSTGGKVVYQLQPLGPGVLNVSTCNNQTNYDTFLWIYADIVNGELTGLLASNDDVGGCGLASRIILPFSGPSARFFVVVGGFGSNEGTFEITFQCTDSTPAPVPSPFFTNDTVTPTTFFTGPPTTSAPTPVIGDCSCSAELELLKTEIVSTVTEQVVSQISALISSSQSSVVTAIQTETQAIISSRIDGLHAQLDALQQAVGNSTN